MSNDEKWMRIAIEEANLAMDKNEVPVGAVLVKNDTLIAQAHNKPITKNDPTAHAEIQLLRKAGEQQKNYRLPESTLYVTLEPCTMCFGAMVHARIDRIVYGASDPKTGVCGSRMNLNEENFFNHKISITSGILEKESSELLKLFFKSRR
ncbi:tRNA adenosine(34) deaminase TadA [Candidatus Pseudothioglobus singularis]|jgi:tRNA(adenine34) deaminase|nr:tRNA adenosine(34) deaminase TadA [Candidatus Pseudothioglobus singularis]|tara:strand:- start:2 stop:451 length:450 start_codon:yes stop_codon:yes gene_type:complete